MPLPLLLTSRAVCDRYSIAGRTLDRWLKDRANPFPAPIKLKKRRFWRIDVIEEWEANLENSIRKALPERRAS